MAVNFNIIMPYSFIPIYLSGNLHLWSNLEWLLKKPDTILLVYNFKVLVEDYFNKYYLNIYEIFWWIKEGKKIPPALMGFIIHSHIIECDNGWNNGK